MKGALEAALQKAKVELSGNKRLAWGLAVIGGILLLQAFMLLLDLRRDQAEAHADAVGKLRKMQSLSGENEWLSRAQVTGRLLRALESEIPQVETAGVAQAQVITWVRDAAVAAGAEEVRIQQAAPEQVEALEGVWKVPVMVSGAAAPAKVVEIIRKVEQRPTLTTVGEAMLLNNANKTFSLTVIAFVRVGAGGGDAGD